MRTDLSGLWVPVITPLDTDGSVDAAALGRLARRLLKDGCTGLVALGTTGEPATLRPAECRAVVDICAEACVEADKPLIVGVGSNCTQATIEAATALDSTPALAALLVVVPYYTRPSPDGIVSHFRAVAAESRTPIVAYNVPYRTGRGLEAEALLELANTRGIVGVKQAVGSFDHDTLELLRRKPTGFQVLAGDDAFIVPTILMGGVGAIAASAHVCSDLFARVIDAALTGASDTAATLAHALLPIVTAGFAEPNPACWKAVLHALGEIATPALRRPMCEATDEATRRLLDAMSAARHETGVSTSRATGSRPT